MHNNASTNQEKAWIFNTQKYNMYDGPGIRTLVFFKGCPLRCKWCSNPEGLEQKHQIMYKSDLCTNCGACVSACPVGIHSINNEGKHEINRNIDCIGCRKCMDSCIEDAISVVGEKKTVDELLEIIEEDEAFYTISGGGVTLGGGEALMQPEFAQKLLKTCKQEGINTAVETCGYTKPESIMEVAKFTDLFLYDLKHIDPDKHFQYTNVKNEVILENLKSLLNNGHNVKVRMPMLKGVNDSESEIQRVIDFLMPYRNHQNFKGIDLLPYHKMGVNKYNQLDMDYQIKGELALSEQELDKIESLISRYDFPVSIIRH
ncbi:choline TMA-lyase-activating enzyme [Proteinivorax hydrogeniformans]|uniref:Choline trimethylamine-lyase activating enzyme n=2 Tax=Proteinivorax hydrogeniformans TaxID=1826727 RepID=A0AAU8HU98_9FIRM